MAHPKGIARLPQDDLREIMIHVARQSGGAFDIARAFAVCKTFGDFVEDRTLLQAVSFKDFFLTLPRDYNLFSEAGGLVARCARAGNIDAQFILAKVAMVFASKLCTAKTETAKHAWSVEQYFPLDLCDLDTAERLLNHFSARNTDSTELLHFVRIFLLRAKVRDLMEMEHHLHNFVALYLARGKTHQHQQFIVILDKLCKLTIPLMTASDPLTHIVEQFNLICTAGYDVMQAMGIMEGVICPLRLCLLVMDDDVEYETVIKHLDIVEPIFQLGDEVAMILGNTDALGTIEDGSCVAFKIRSQLSQLMNREAFLDSSRESLLASFDALFTT